MAFRRDAAADEASAAPAVAGKGAPRLRPKHQRRRRKKERLKSLHRERPLSHPARRASRSRRIKRLVGRRQDAAVLTHVVGSQDVAPSVDGAAEVVPP